MTIPTWYDLATSDKHSGLSRFFCFPYSGELKAEKVMISLIKENRKLCSRICLVSGNHFDGSPNTLDIPYKTS